jgi:hypothetical protein
VTIWKWLGWWVTLTRASMSVFLQRLMCRGAPLRAHLPPLWRRVLLGIVTCLMLRLPGLPHRPGDRAPVRSAVLTSAVALVLTTLSGGAAYCRSLPRLLHALLATGGALLSYRYGIDTISLICLSCGR